jgi:hypothetical protein
VVVIPPEAATALTETLNESANALRLLSLAGEMSPSELETNIAEMMDILNGLPTELAGSVRAGVADNLSAARTAAANNWKPQ